MTMRRQGNRILLAVCCLFLMGYIVYGLLPRGSPKAATTLSRATPWPSYLSLGNLSLERLGVCKGLPVHWRGLYRLYGNAEWLIEADSWSQQELLSELPQVATELGNLARRQPRPLWTRLLADFKLDVSVKSPQGGSMTHVATVSIMDRHLDKAPAFSGLREEWRLSVGPGPEIYTKNQVIRIGWAKDLEWAGDRQVAVSELESDAPNTLVRAPQGLAASPSYVALSNSGIRLTATLLNPTDSAWADSLELTLDGQVLSAITFNIPAHQRAVSRLEATLPIGTSKVYDLDVELKGERIWSTRLLILHDTYVLKDHQAVYQTLRSPTTQLQEAGSTLYLESIHLSGPSAELVIGFRSSDCHCYLGLQAFLSDLALPSGFRPKPPKLDFDISPETPHVGETVMFRVRDLGRFQRTALRLQWDFGDGNQVVATGAETQHVFAKPGNYIVTLLISDGTATTRMEREIFIRHIPTPFLGVGVSYINPIPIIGLTLQAPVFDDLLVLSTFGFGSRSMTRQDTLGNEVAVTYSIMYGILSCGARLSETSWIGAGAGLGILRGQFYPEWQKDPIGYFEELILLLQANVSWNLGPLMLSLGVAYPAPYTMPLQSAQ